jgi:hypothetical protein
VCSGRRELKGRMSNLLKDGNKYGKSARLLKYFLKQFP